MLASRPTSKCGKTIRSPVAKGHDPQLEKAVRVTLDALQKHPVVIPDHPPYPNYHKN